MAGQHAASPSAMKGLAPWGLVALMAVAHPELFDDWERHIVEFPFCDSGEPCDGNALVSSPMPHATTSHLSAVALPHRARNEAKLMHETLELLRQVEAHGPAPRLPWGLLSQLTLAGKFVGTRKQLLRSDRQAS